MPPASLPLPPVSGWASGEPAAALPPPLNLHDRSIAVTSAWKVFLSKVDITAGLLATTEASPLADAAPAIERPWALPLFSLSRKAAAWAWLQAMAPATPRAREVICTRRGGWGGRRVGRWSWGGSKARRGWWAGPRRRPWGTGGRASRGPGPGRCCP